MVKDEQQPVEQQGGAHRDGLIHAFRLDSRGTGLPVGWPDIEADPLGGGDARDLWVHMDRAAPGLRRWLTDTARVPEQGVDMLLIDDPRPKFVYFAPDADRPEGFVLILRGANLNPSADPENMVAIRLWVDQNRVISLLRRRLLAVEAVRDDLGSGIGATDSVDLVNRLAGALLDRIDAVVEELEGELERAEENLEKTTHSAARERIGEIRRAAIRLRRYLGPQRDLFLHAAADLPPWVTKRDRLRLRAKADRVARIIEDIEELDERAGFAHEELHAALEERTNRTTMRLTTVATVLLPMSLVASMWGMNLKGLPFEEDPNGFWWMAGVIAVVGVVLSVVTWVISLRK